MIQDDNTFEAVIYCKQRYADDFIQWPANMRTMAERSVDDLLEKRPTMKVVERRSYCIAKGDPRFPDETNGNDFAMVLEVRLANRLTIIETT